MKRLEPRHWAFLGLFVVVLATMLLGFRPSMGISPDTQKMFNYIDSLPSGSIVMFSFDHEASALPEIKPLALALLRHSFSKGHRIIGVALMAEGTAVGYRLMETVAGEYGKQYGSDFAYLGFKPQFIAAILSMGESIPKTFPRDYLGTPVEQIPLLKNVRAYSDLAGVISISDGNLATHWIEYGHARFNVTVSAAVTAAMVTSYDPYLSSGQLNAMVSGLRGAAEYEQLIKIGGGGQRGMMAQSVSHLYVLALIVIGNIMYFTARRRRGKSS
jgi:hypothetical protein